VFVEKKGFSSSTSKLFLNVGKIRKLIAILSLFRVFDPACNKFLGSKIIEVPFPPSY